MSRTYRQNKYTNNFRSKRSWDDDDFEYRPSHNKHKVKDRRDLRREKMERFEEISEDENNNFT